jgi:hypothetical protein
VSLGPLLGRPLNVGHQNLTVADIARTIADRVADRSGGPVSIATTSSDDVRSYRLTSTTLARTLGITPRIDVGQAADEIAAAILDGRLPDPIENPIYYNVRYLRRHGADVGAGPPGRSRSIPGPTLEAPPSRSPGRP